MSEEKQQSDAIVMVYPRIVHQGQYRLYEKADGTLHCVYHPDTAEEPQHFEIPGELMDLMDKAVKGELKPQDMMKLAMRFMGGGLAG